MGRPNDNTEYRAWEGAAAGRTGIIANLALFAAKLTAGIISGSIAITADAINNLTDSAASIIAIIGFRMSKRPADKGHPYGHARSEYIAGFIVAAVILLAGFDLMRSSAERIAEPKDPVFSWVSMGILIGSVIVKLALFAYYRVKWRRLDSPLLKALADDSRNDVLSTSAVIASVVVFAACGINVDGIIGLCIGGFIFYSAIRVAKLTISPLLGAAASRETVKSIEDLVLSHGEVIGIHDLLVHEYGPGHCFASAHIEMSADIPPLECHDIIDDIERDALRELNIHLVMHYDPVYNDDELIKVKEAAKSAVTECCPDACIHDLRIIKKDGRRCVYFDVDMPFGMLGEKDAVERAAKRAISETGDYDVSITFEGS